MHVMIVEDELASQQYLSTFLLRHFPELTISGIIDNVPDAIRLLQQSSPDILFLDIEIKMGTGFDILNALPRLKAEVIFTTAFNQFAIAAFEHHAVDYLLKPLQDERLKDATGRCINRIQSKNSHQQIEALLAAVKQSAAPKKRLSVHTLHGIEFVDPDSILYAMAKGNYTDLKLRSGARLTITKKLKEIEEHLPELMFFRIHNSYIVQSACIVKYQKGRGGSVILSDDTELPVSSSRRDELIKHLEA